MTHSECRNVHVDCKQQQCAGLGFIGQILPNKWSRCLPRGPNIWIYQEMGRFSFVVREQLSKGYKNL